MPLSVAKGFIKIAGAREHNLKNLTLEIPRDKLVVITGPSGSGKSSLAFDTLFAEGQRKYVETLSSYARQFLDQLQKPDVDHIEGLSPAIAIEQRSSVGNPRSTIATTTEIYDYLRLLFVNVGQAHLGEFGSREAIAVTALDAAAVADGDDLQLSEQATLLAQHVQRPLRPLALSRGPVRHESILLRARPRWPDTAIARALHPCNAPLNSIHRPR